MAPLPTPFLLSSFCSSGWEGGTHSPPGGFSLGFLILLSLPWSSGWSSGWSCFLSNPIHHNFLSDGFCKTQQLPTNTFGFMWDIFWSLLRIPPYLINVARLFPTAVFKFWTKKFFRSLRVLIRGFHLRGIPMEALQYASPHSNLHKTEGNGKELRIGGNNFP